MNLPTITERHHSRSRRALNSKLLHSYNLCTNRNLRQIARRIHLDLHHDDAFVDWRFLALDHHDLGRFDLVLQPGAVRGQRVSAGAAPVADPAAPLHPVRFGLAKGGKGWWGWSAFPQKLNLVISSQFPCPNHLVHTCDE